ncbi:MAG: glycosyltransferase family 2 protein [Candidatus Paceibacterota bacterium]|jgi:glycosyltransferase involved in cell wall biosynthesis
MEPKITLAIPAYNEEKYIGTCLDHAIKNSDGGFFEILVIDNASADKTAEVAAKFPGVRVVREEKKGLTRARQRAFEEMRGDILAFVDADTQMPKGWCETVRDEFAKNGTLAALSGPYVYYDISKYQQFLVKLYWYLLGFPVYFILGYMVVGGNFAIRKSVLEKMKGFDTAIEFYGEDTNVARRAHAFGKVKFSAKFIMYTSGRRLAGQGMLTTSLLYMSNYISEAFFHKPTTQKYTDIR